MKRILQPELLDSLPSDDPGAMQSRRDLQKVNLLMGNARVLGRALRRPLERARLVVELGAGDGTLLLRVARQLGRPRQPVRAILVDRLPAVSARTRDAFAAAGWQTEIEQADVFEWLGRAGSEMADAMIANLFLHHFRDRQLEAFFALAARQTSLFVAAEPLRSRVALAGAPLLRLIGCNRVTMHDAAVSIRAGFRDGELSALWPARQRWRLSERRAGLFTHAFAAEHADMKQRRPAG